MQNCEERKKINGKNIRKSKDWKIVKKRIENDEERQRKKNCDERKKAETNEKHEKNVKK